MPPIPRASLLAAIVGSVLCACGGGGGGGDDGPPPAPARPAPLGTDLGRFEPLPGIDLDVVSVSGGSDAGGNVRPGDVLTVTYTLTTDAGVPLDVATLASGSAYVSGPTFNYQRVIAPQSDVRSASVYLGDATWSYTFPVPVPETYLPPYNDTPSFGPLDGELTGTPLLDGTYTVGIQLRQDYRVGTEVVRDPGAATSDFLVGTVGAVVPRAVVGNDNCNACHTEVRAHGGTRVDVRLCVLCHVSGAEDRNSPTAAGGTPGTSIDFRVMIHKLHAGKHLPSVQGVDTLPDGTRTYDAPPEPYVLVGFGDQVFDYSRAAFPVWPSLTVGMPRDLGYSALPAAARAEEDEILRGVVACAKCHGDPDGGGPRPAPAQGVLHEVQPSRHACGSCHDDVRWEHPYTANGETMPADADVTACAVCHPQAGTNLAVRDGHLHPLHDRTLEPGLVVDVTSVAEGGTSDGDVRFDPGEKVSVAFTLRDASGAPVQAASLSALSAAVAGPTTNLNRVHDVAVPLAMLAGGSSSQQILLPQQVLLEWVGDATVGIDAFPTSRTPHLDLAGAPTTVLERTATAGGSTAAAAPTALFQNFVDVVSTASFARNDAVVVADGTALEEYAQVLLVDGPRLWLNVPLRQPHPAGTPVREVTLTTRTAGVHYALDPATGTISDGPVPFGTGNAVVVTYWTHFVVPARHPPPFNDSPDLDETWGEWTGKTLAAGTYLVTLWGHVNRFVNYDRTPLASTAGFPDATTYRGTSPPAATNVRVGDVAAIVPYAAVEGPAACHACHDDMWFHGGQRRGFATCISCHGTMGSEDRPRHVAANAPPTPGVAVAFREMLHKIHRGRDLPDAATYTVVGFGAAPYPNNFTAFQYSEVVFPAMPGGVSQCAKCHGASLTWTNPPPRDHPTEQGRPVRVWGLVCGSCHSSAEAHAHIDTQTAPTGEESCSVCHGPGRDEAVDEVHRVR